jgi:transglutaminase-like putative cysteine protease
MTTVRRTFLKNTAALAVASALPAINFAQGAPAQRQFNPQPGTWRTFDVTTRVDILEPEGVTQVWLPVPSVDTDWQHSLDNAFSTNGAARMASDAHYGARMLYVEFAVSEKQPFVEITSRIQTQNRAVNWAAKQAVQQDAASLQFWTRPTALLPTDGIVLATALKATHGAKTDVDKVRRIYDWVVANTYREPKVRGCGEGDIKTMLETGNLGGKCADLNAIFVGMCRSLGIPARDVYGIRLVPSAFGYKELSGNPASLKGAQHCRAEVFLKDFGWVAMDPADVAKVMRLETPEWIKTTDNPVVAPVNQALFGGWEGNWLAWNNAHDVALPNSTGPKLGFFMYPAAETGDERLDAYSPDAFKYQITAREIRA